MSLAFTGHADPRIRGSRSNGYRTRRSYLGSGTATEQQIGWTASFARGSVIGVQCSCSLGVHQPRLVVLTGGPGAGKTAVLEVVRRQFCEHVSVLPEAASILFLGGFPRRQGLPGRTAAQRAIWHVARELERMALEEQRSAIVLCDRGTLDGLAYWPAEAGPLTAAMGTTVEAEMARYAAVIHLRTPSARGGYNHQNPARIETAVDAAHIDEAIARAWDGHPRRSFVESTPDFVDKMRQAIELIRAEVPACCRPPAGATG